MCVSINVALANILPGRLLFRVHSFRDIIHNVSEITDVSQGESRMSQTRASLYFSRRLHHQNDYRLIFWLWENDYTTKTIRDKPDWTYVKKNGTTTAQVVRLSTTRLLPPPSPHLPGRLSTVRGLSGKSEETLKGFTGLRTLDSAWIGSGSTGKTKCTLKKKKRR